MYGHEPLELVICLEIVRFLHLREQQTTRDCGDSSLIAELVKTLSTRINIESFLSSQTTFAQEGEVGDHYEIGQAGAVGPNSIAIGQNFHQIWTKNESHIDLGVLAQELCKVRDKGRSSASGSPEEDVALAELAHAEIAAREGNGPKVMSHLARAGRWALQIAVAIGVPVATKALEAAIGTLKS